MKTMMKRLIAGATITALASAFNGCAPVVVASRPHPVYQPVPAPLPAPAPVAVVVPVVPAWAPPYMYVNEVHYYYFPDYMVYYDVFATNYCYFDGYNWLHVSVLPALPLYYGFSPFNSYFVVLNRNTYNPWMQNSYYQTQYPVGYYQTTYAPRTSLGSNTVLRAYDENQNRPLFVDKRSNREVKVNYDVVQTPRGSAGNERNAVASPRDGRVNTNPSTGRQAIEKNNTGGRVMQNSSNPNVQTENARTSTPAQRTEKVPVERTDRGRSSTVNTTNDVPVQNNSRASRVETTRQESKPARTESMPRESRSSEKTSAARPAKAAAEAGNRSQNTRPVSEMPATENAVGSQPRGRGSR